VPVRIYLPRKLLTCVKAIAEKQGISFAEYTRRAMELRYKNKKSLVIMV